MNDQVVRNESDTWMEIKFVLKPEEYHRLREKAVSEALGVSEFVQKNIRQILQKQ